MIIFEKLNPTDIFRVIRFEKNGDNGLVLLL